MRYKNVATISKKVAILKWNTTPLKLGQDSLIYKKEDKKLLQNVHNCIVQHCAQNQKFCQKEQMG